MQAVLASSRELFLVSLRSVRLVRVIHSKRRSRTIFPFYFPKNRIYSEKTSFETATKARVRAGLRVGKGGNVEEKEEIRLDIVKTTWQKRSMKANPLRPIIPSHFAACLGRFLSATLPQRCSGQDGEEKNRKKIGKRKRKWVDRCREMTRTSGWRGLNSIDQAGADFEFGN